MYVQNPTPLAAQVFCTLDVQGAELAVLVAKGTWQDDGAGALRFADEQRPIVTQPAYRGEPGASPLQSDTDLTPPKPGTDCLLRGTVHADGAREVDVSFTVEDDQRTAAQAHAVVSGPRQWQTTLGVASIVGPLPFDRLELSWEHAFGGQDRADEPNACAENPVGVGFRGRGSRQPIDGAWLPQIERPSDRLTGPNRRPNPVGFGPVAPTWAPRQTYAGTYDEAWRGQRAPLLPDDFDVRFYQSAPAELVATPHLGGGERVTVRGCGRAPWSLVLPKVRVQVGLVAGFRPEPGVAILDTLIVDADARTVEVVWRAAFSIHGRVDAVDGVMVYTEDL